MYNIADPLLLNPYNQLKQSKSYCLYFIFAVIDYVPRSGKNSKQLNKMN